MTDEAASWHLFANFDGLKPVSVEHDHIALLSPSGSLATGRYSIVCPATPAMELRGDQLGELGRDVCNRLFCSAQTASRAEQGADFAESFIRRAVHDWNEQVTR
jgi:hypothetical protein